MYMNVEDMAGLYYILNEIADLLCRIYSGNRSKKTSSQSMSVLFDMRANIWLVRTQSFNRFSQQICMRSLISLVCFPQY